MPRRKAKPQEPEVKPEVVEEKPKEVKEEPKQVEEKPTVEPAPAAPKAKPTPVVKDIAWEEFEKFVEPLRERRSWVKEVIEKARQGPVRVEGLSRGKVLALIRQVNDYNFRGSDVKIAYKYDVKNGVVLLAPVKK